MLERCGDCGRRAGGRHHGCRDGRLWCSGDRRRGAARGLVSPPQPRAGASCCQACGAALGLPAALGARGTAASAGLVALALGFGALLAGGVWALRSEPSPPRPVAIAAAPAAAVPSLPPGVSPSVGLPSAADIPLEAASIAIAVSDTAPERASQEAVALATEPSPVSPIDSEGHRLRAGWLQPTRPESEPDAGALVAGDAQPEPLVVAETPLTPSAEVSSPAPEAPLRAAPVVAGPRQAPAAAPAQPRPVQPMAQAAPQSAPQASAGGSAEAPAASRPSGDGFAVRVEINGLDPFSFFGSVGGEREGSRKPGRRDR